MQDRHAVIIGGGIIGLAIAFELAQMGGWQVAVVERHRVGAGTTAKATGGIRTQFSTEANVQLALLGRERFAHWQDIYGGDPRFQRIGYLFFSARADQAEVLRRGAERQRRWGVDVSVVEPAEMAGLVPHMTTEDLAVGTFTESDGLGDPGAAAAALESACRRAGVAIHEGEDVRAIELNGAGEAVGVGTASGRRLFGEVVVVATGAWTAPLMEPLGFLAPIAPHRRQVYRTGPVAEWPPVIPLAVDLDTGLYCHSDGAAVVFGGGDRHVAPGFDEVPQPADVVRLADPLMHRWPLLQAAPIVQTWAGLREMTPDDHGLVGPVPGHPGLFIAAGFSGHGFMQAPAVGLVMAALIAGAAPPVDMAALDPGRFQGQARAKEEQYVF